MSIKEDSLHTLRVFTNTVTKQCWVDEKGGGGEKGVSTCNPDGLLKFIQPEKLVIKYRR
jgi:hypothetical protein